MNFFKSRWFSFLFFKEVYLYLIFMFLCLVASSVLGYTIPLSLTRLYENYHDKNLFQSSVLVLVLIFILEYINRVFYQIMVNYYVLKVIKKVRETCYSNWLYSFERQSHQNNQSNQNNQNKDKAKKNVEFPLGEVLARIMNDTEALRELVTSGSFSIVIDIFFIFSCLVGLIKLNFISGMTLMGVEIFVALLLVYSSRYLAKIFFKVRHANGQLSRCMVNLTHGFQQTYYTPHHQYAQKRSDQVLDDFLKIQLKANFWDASYYSFGESLFPLFLALVVIIFPYSHITEIAIVAVIIDLIQRSIQPIKDMAGKISNFQRAFTGIHRIEEFNHVIESYPKSKLLSKNILADDHHQEVHFESLKVLVEEFFYPSSSQKFALKNISFEGKKGELIGIVGLSGSGKSTLLNILAGFLVPHKGSIQIFEHNKSHPYCELNEFDQDFNIYKDQVALITQDSHVFSASLFFNITLINDEIEHFNKNGSKEFSLFWEKVTREIPYLSRWGIRPEDKVRPSQLSLGQKQIISTLRACYQQKSIVLLDEVSSSLDSNLEEALRKLILWVQQRSLTIIVAHRVETLIEANQIIVMKDGMVEKIGQHADLLQHSPVYQEFIAELKTAKKEKKGDDSQVEVTKKEIIVT